MEKKRKQKGEQLIITKKQVEQMSKGGGQFSKERLNCEIEDKSFSKSDRNAGEIDKGKGGAMTKKEELKIGVVGQKKSSDSSEKKRAGEGNLCNHNQWQRMIIEQDNLCYCILTLQ